MNWHGLVLVSLLAAVLPAQAWSLQEVPDPTDFRVDDWFLVDANGDGAKDILWIDPAGGVIALQHSPFKDAPLRSTLPPVVRAFQFAEVLDPPGEDLLLLHAEGVMILPGCTGTPEPWFTAPLAFTGTLRDGCPCLGWGRDVTGDGHEEILLPTPEGEMLLLRDRAGKPLSLRRIGPRPRVTHARGGGGLYTERLEFPRADLLATGTHRDALALVLDAQGLARLADKGDALEPVFTFPGAPSKAFGQLERVECSVSDLDGSGTDAVLVARTRVDEARIPEPRTELLLFRQGAREPAGVLLLGGLLSAGPDLLDLNGDGGKDLLLAVVPAGVTGELQKLQGRLPVTWHIWFHNKAAMPWGRSPDFTWTDTLDAVCLERWGLRHRLLVGPDQDGDGLLDLASLARKDEAWRITTWLQTRDKALRFTRSSADAPLVQGPLHSLGSAELGKGRGLVFRRAGSLLLARREPPR